jgi:hypothetical protein
MALSRTVTLHNLFPATFHGLVLATLVLLSRFTYSVLGFYITCMAIYLAPQSENRTGFTSPLLPPLRYSAADGDTVRKPRSASSTYVLTVASAWNISIANVRLLVDHRNRGEP